MDAAALAAALKATVLKAIAKGFDLKSITANNITSAVLSVKENNGFLALNFEKLPVKQFTTQVLNLLTDDEKKNIAVDSSPALDQQLYADLKSTIRAAQKLGHKIPSLTPNNIFSAVMVVKTDNAFLVKKPKDVKAKEFTIGFIEKLDKSALAELIAEDDSVPAPASASTPAAEPAPATEPAPAVVTADDFCDPDDDDEDEAIDNELDDEVEAIEDAFKEIPEEKHSEAISNAIANLAEDLGTVNARYGKTPEEIEAYIANVFKKSVA